MEKYVTQQLANQKASIHSHSKWKWGTRMQSMACIVFKQPCPQNLIHNLYWIFTNEDTALTGKCILCLAVHATLFGLSSHKNRFRTVCYEVENNWFRLLHDKNKVL